MATDRRGTQLMWATTLVSAAMILSRLLGFVRDSLVAAYFGQTATVDQYNAAYVIPDTIYLLLIGGAISAAFVPVVSGYLTQGESRKAERLINIALNLVIVGMIPLLLLGEVLAPFLVRGIAVGFQREPGAIAHTAYLTRIMLGAVLFHAINGVLVGTQYARKSFWATAIGPLFYNLAIIGVGAVFGHLWGIQAFAWGVLIGAFLNFLFQLWGVWQLRFRYYWVLDLKDPGLIAIGRLMLPIVFGMGLGQINLIINQTFLASLLPPGSINALRLASRIMMTPVSIATSLAITLLPSLTEVAALRDFVSFRQYLSTGIRAVIFLSVPATIGLMLLGHPLVGVLFHHGRFTSSNVSLTAGAVFYYALGILPYGAIGILVSAFYALKDTRTPFVIGAIVLAIGLALSWIFLKAMREDGLALAYTLVGYINMFLLIIWLRHRLGLLDGTRMARTTVRTAIASGIMGLGIYMASSILNPWLYASHTHVIEKIIALILVVGVGTSLFMLAAQRFHIEEYQLIRDRLLRRKRRLSPVS